MAMTNLAEGISQDRLDAVAAAFSANAAIYGAKGSPLYESLCMHSGTDPAIVALAARGQARAQPALHLLGAVHYLLIQEPDDPLSRFFGTLTENAGPAEEAFGPFKRFCSKHEDAISEILVNRTIQTTYVERCGGLLPGLSYVADLAGEPLNLIEVGCSAGILLTFDKYRYVLTDGSNIGNDAATMTLESNISNAPAYRKLRIPEIGSRIGIDLHPVDARSASGRDWILALSFPEFRDAHRRLTLALDTVAQSNLTLLEGDALDRLPEAIEASTGPLCIFHSACLYYWTAEGKRALDALLTEAGRSREIYRLGIELPDSYTRWANGDGGDHRAADPECEVTLTQYHEGNMFGRLIGYVRSNAGAFRWID